MRRFHGGMTGLLLLCLFCFSQICLASAYDDLVQAIDKDDETLVANLLRRGMDVDSVDRDGNTLLMLAARAGRLRSLELLLKNRANVLITNKYNDSAVMLAALRGKLEIVAALVAAGADLDPEGWTPLIYAAFEGHTEIVRLLLQQDVDIDARAPNGMTALMAAARNGYAESVQLLMDEDADHEARTPQGQTAMDLAKAGKHTAVVEILGKASGDSR